MAEERLEEVNPEPGATPPMLTVRVVVLSVAALSFAFLINNYLLFWQNWPGIAPFFSGTEPVGAKSILQLLLYAGAIGLCCVSVMTHRRAGLLREAVLLSGWATYMIRAAFWAVFLIGLVDFTISFTRIEGLLPSLLGEQTIINLGRARFRAEYIHLPLIFVSLILAWRTRTLGFIWLSLLIVLSEFQIVISRFIFSYEQAFMGDLVRFWYAALFLFASAYTLIEEGHVRVDVIYAGMSERSKAWSNLIGSAILGIPLCWVIILLGMWDKSNIINAPLLSYEVSQSGYGLYVKYLMAAFLLIYALSMLMQFLGYILRNINFLVSGKDREAAHDPSIM